MVYQETDWQRVRLAVGGWPIAQIALSGRTNQHAHLVPEGPGDSVS